MTSYSSSDSMPQSGPGAAENNAQEKSLGIAPTQQAITVRLSEETIFLLLSRMGIALGVSVERSNVVVLDHDLGSTSGDPLHWLKASAMQSGVYLKEVAFDSFHEAIGFLYDGTVLLRADQPTPGSLEFTLAHSLSGRQVEVVTMGSSGNEPIAKQRTLSRRQFKKLIFSADGARWFVAMRELQCDTVSSSPQHRINGSHGVHDPHDHHGHLSPLRRFAGLLKWERRDVATVFLFAFVAGILALATPLAVESLVNVVSWGTYVQPLLVLGLMLLVCLGLAGVLRVLQSVLVEMIQRRQFVHIVSDLAHRFPRANQAALEGEYSRELANRVFDIMTIQKSTAVLLLDGVSIALTTGIGMALLAFYHPFLLGFDIVLLISMISITWVLGRGGIRTAIDESITKYRVAHWLQDVLSYPSVFKTGGGESLAIGRANQLTADYINARRRQYAVVLRQIAFAICLQTLASTTLLALGGWLVIVGQLTLGQLVASELVVTVVVGAFAKAGKSLEKFYDLMAGVDKVGHLIDIPADPRYELAAVPEGALELRWGDLTFIGPTTSAKIPSVCIPAGSKTAIVGGDHFGRTSLARSLAGLLKPAQGLVQVAGFDAMHAAARRNGGLVAYAAGLDIFHGSLGENVDLGRSSVRHSDVRQALRLVQLEEAVLRLPEGLMTHLQTGGYPLTDSEKARLVIARAIVTQPRALVIDRLLDTLDTDLRQKIWDALADSGHNWTLVVVTDNQTIAQGCDTRIEVRLPASEWAEA